METPATIQLPPAPRPILFSVAGFKAMPYEAPPSIPLEGLVVLMGTNSSGKSSLLLALRVLVASLIQEPSLERLHLRAPGLPEAKLRAVRDIRHAPPVGEEPNDDDAARFMRDLVYRIAFSDDHLLECRFEFSPNSHQIVPDLVSTTPRNARDRGHAQPVTLRPSWISVSGGHPHLRLFRAECSPAPEDPWDERWRPLEGDYEQLTGPRVEWLRSWALGCAFLDSIRAEQSLGQTAETLTLDLASNSVLPDGSNASSLIAAIHQGGYGEVSWSPPMKDLDPATSQPWFVPDAARIPQDGQAIDVLSHLLEWSGLERLQVLNHAPGYTSELRTAGTQRSLAQLGDGQRQLLPALVQAILSHPLSQLIWEHPDLHLHPGAATAIGRLAYRLASSGRTVVIETHSRDLVDGVRTETATLRIATTRGRANPGLSPAAARLVYLGRDGDRIESTCYDLTDPNVEIPMWPRFVAPEVRDRRQFEASLWLDAGTLSPAQVEQLLRKPEDQHLERKSSLSWNRAENRSDPEVTFGVMRAIAGFCNHPDGGDLLLGIDDAGRVVGLDPNLPDFDVFQRHLVNVVGRDLGPNRNLYHEHLRVHLLTCGGVDFVLVHCRPAREAVALRNKKQQRDDFYVRVGNTTRALAPSEVPKWIDERFGS